MKLGDYLKQKHLATEAFAAQIGVDRTTVGRWLGPDGNGKLIRPRWEVMIQIAAVTGGAVMPNDFMEDLPELIEGFDLPGGALKDRDGEPPVSALVAPLTIRRAS